MRTASRPRRAGRAAGSATSSGRRPPASRRTRTRSPRAARPEARSGAARSRSIGEAAPSAPPPLFAVLPARKSREHAPTDLEAAASADPDPERPAAGRLWQVSREEHRRRSRPGHGGHLQGRPRGAARCRALSPGRHAQMAGAAARAARERSLGRGVRGQRVRSLAVHGRGLGRSLCELPRRARPEARGGAARPLGRALGGRGALRRRRACRVARVRAGARREGSARKGVVGKRARGRRRA